MGNYDPRLELATRDTVARSIDQEMKKSGDDCVYLDVSHKDADFLKNRFPTIFGKCLDFGIDITREPIPVVPAAHYQCGGILVDQYGKTNIHGLMALGEVSCTGLHGANRLASNSLLEAVVYAERAAGYCVNNMNNSAVVPSSKFDPWYVGEAECIDEEILINHNWDMIRRIMWNYVGIVRSEKRLVLARSRIKEIVKEIEEHYVSYHVSQNMLELRNIGHIALLVVESALQRKESRGLHFCIEYPEKSEDCRFWTVLKRIRGEKPWSIKSTRYRFNM